MSIVNTRRIYSITTLLVAGVLAGCSAPAAALSSPEVASSASIGAPTSTLPAQSQIPAVSPPVATSATLAPASPSSTASALPVPSSTSTPDEGTSLARQLAMLVDSPTWHELGFSEDRRQSWEAFASQTSDLPEAELILVKSFLEQYDFLAGLSDLRVIPARTQVFFRVRESEAEDGEQQLTVYAAEPDPAQDGSAERIFLVVYDADGKAIGLLRSPTIPGLQPRICAGSLLVEYLDEDGKWLVRADARLLDEKKEYDAALADTLQRQIPDPVYLNTKVYPRYRFNLSGIDSGFYAVENLTVSQMHLFLSIFELFERPELRGLTSQVFLPQDDVAYIITTDSRPFAAAAAYVVDEEPLQAVVLLFTKALFDNRYLTAAAVTHEAAHIWQGEFPGCENSKQILADEIADQTIPSDLLDWDAERLFDAVRSGDIGAYHVSMWVLNYFNQQEMVEWSRSVITTGKSNGQSIIVCE